VANGRANMGQFFTTGSKAGGYHVAAIWIRQAGYTTDTVDTYWSFAADANPTFTFRLTDPSQVNTAGFALDTEAVTVSGTEINNPGGFNFSLTGTGIWLRLGFSSAGRISCCSQTPNMVSMSWAQTPTFLKPSGPPTMFTAEARHILAPLQRACRMTRPTCSWVIAYFSWRWWG